MKLAEYSLSEETLDALAEKVLDSAEFTSVSIYTVDHKSHRLIKRFFLDRKAEESSERSAPQRVFDLLKKENKMAILSEDSPVHAGETYEKQDRDNRCEVYIPLKRTLGAKEEVFGIILLTAEKALQENDIRESGSLSETLRKLNRYLSAEDDFARRKESMIDAAYMLCEIIDGKEPYLIGRLFNVAYWAVKIARYMRLSEENVEKLQIAVLLHDLGKAYIDVKILDKKGRLTEEEYETIKKRVVFSHDIALKLNELFVMPDLPDIIVNYQERIDGKGYPNGKRGEEIPLLSKILGTARAMSSMLTNTSYQRAKSIPEVIKELKENSNRQFDKRVVEAAIAVLTDEKKENQVVFNRIGVFATLNIILKNDSLDDIGTVAKSIKALGNDAAPDEEAGAGENEINDSMNIWGNVREIENAYVFIPTEKTIDFYKIRFQYLKLYISVNDRMFRYIPEIRKVYPDKIVFSELKLVEDTNAFAIRWLLEGFFVSPTRKAYKVFVTMIGGDFVDFYIFSEELQEVFSQGIIRITFEDGKNSTLPGMIMYSEKLGDKTHFRMKFAGLKESEKQMIFSQIFKKQIEIRNLQNKEA